MDTPDHSSFIHDLQIASPCKVDWDSMSGDERKRFCGQCKLNVYNISAMTLPEAEKLVADSEGNVCLRMYRRVDGTVITQDCPVGIAAKVKRRMQRSFAYACAAVTLIIGWAANIRLGDQPSLFQQLTTIRNEHSSSCGFTSGHATMGRPSTMSAEMGNVAPAPVTKPKEKRAVTTDIEFVEPAAK
jgi:hypothetical protein